MGKLVKLRRGATTAFARRGVPSVRPPHSRTPPHCRQRGVHPLQHGAMPRYSGALQYWRNAASLLSSRRAAPRRSSSGLCCRRRRRRRRGARRAAMRRAAAAAAAADTMLKHAVLLHATLLLPPHCGRDDQGFNPQ